MIYPLSKSELKKRQKHRATEEKKREKAAAAPAKKEQRASVEEEESNLTPNVRCFNRPLLELKQTISLLTPVSSNTMKYDVEKYRSSVRPRSPTLTPISFM